MLIVRQYAWNKYKLLHAVTVAAAGPGVADAMQTGPLGVVT